MNHQEAHLVLQSNTLQRCIDSWVKLQHLFLPVLAAKQEKESGNGDVIPMESYKLMLPSEIGRSISCDEHLRMVEWRLCYSQALDALHSLWSNLQAQSCILKFKDRNLRGQGANTRARNTLKAVEARIEATANRYEVWTHASSREALTFVGRYDDTHMVLCKLAPLLKENGTWNSVLQPLNHQDIHAMSDLLRREPRAQGSFPGYGVWVE